MTESYLCPKCKLILEIDKENMYDFSCCPYCGCELNLSPDHMPQKAEHIKYRKNYDSERLPFLIGIIIWCIILFLCYGIISYLDGDETTLTRIIGLLVRIITPIWHFVKPVVIKIGSLLLILNNWINKIIFGA